MSSALLRERGRYRRATDLYVVGRELPLKDGSIIWLQAMNPLEKDEAVSDAQAAAARVALALKEDGSEEQIRVRVMFMADGDDGAIARLVEAHETEAYFEAVDELEADEEWVEKVGMIRRGPDLLTQASPAEQEFYRRTLLEFTDEIGKRLRELQEVEEERIRDLDPEARWEEYLAWWAEQRGSEVGLVEMRYTEAFYAARVCIAERVDDRYDHSNCEQHTVRIYEDKAEVRGEPEDFLSELFRGLVEMEVSERQAKLRAALASSSEPSASRSSAVESAPSTPEAT